MTTQGTNQVTAAHRVGMLGPATQMPVKHGWSSWHVKRAVGHLLADQRRFRDGGISSHHCATDVAAFSSQKNENLGRVM